MPMRLTLTLPTRDAVKLKILFNEVQTLATKDCKGPQTNMPKNVGSIKT